MDIGKYLELYSEDLKLKNYSDSTIENYVCQVGSFLSHFNSLVTLPIVLSQSEVKRMFDVCDNLKHKTILALLYSCGIRVRVELHSTKHESVLLENKDKADGRKRKSFCEHELRKIIFSHGKRV